MKIPHEFWSHCDIYCINLKKRTDRKAHAESEFQKLGILPTIQFFYALEKETAVESLFTTVLKILEKETNKPILIFEDDFIFDQTTCHYLDDLLPYVKNPNTFDSWDLIRLGYRSARFVEQINTNIFRGNCHSTLATVYSPKFANILKNINISTLKGLDLHIDRYLRQITGRSILPYNPIFLPARLGSDIRWNLIGNTKIDEYQLEYINNPLENLKRKMQETHLLWEKTKNLSLKERIEYYEKLPRMPWDIITSSF
jgi:GR25 family glycosyltransferase involved in LPS biosynthesis